MKKNRIIILIGIIFLFMLVALFLPIKTSKLKGNANIELLGFKDKKFYDCVTASYMMEEMNIEDIDKIFDRYQNTINFFMFESGGYTLLGNNKYELREDELKKITNLQCYDVKDTTGIEKLTALEEIEITGSFNSLDLTNSPNINNVNIRANKLDSFKLPDESKLRELVIYSNSIKNIDLKNVSSVYDFDLKTVNLESVELPKKIDYSLSIDSKKLTTLDFSAIEYVSDLNLYTPNLTDLNLADAKINNLWISRANLEKVDLSNVSYYYVYDRVKEVKTNKNNYLEFTYNTKKIEFADGAYIKLVSDELQFEDYSEHYLLLRNVDISIEDIKNGIEVNNLKIKICASNSICSDEITNVSNLDGAYLVLYQNDSLIKGFKIAYFDNDDFQDFKIYSHVIYNYNSNKNTNYTTKTNLTDEELSIITSLSNNKDYIISSTKGLEKLINLNTLSIEGDIDVNDIKNLKQLNTLRLRNTNINKLDVSIFDNLEYLEISNSYIDEVNIDNKKLKKIEMYSNVIGKFNIFENVKNDNALTDLQLRDCGITSLDFTNLINVDEFDISNNDIEKLDFSFIKNRFYGNIEEVPLKKIEGLDSDFLHSYNTLEEFILTDCSNVETIQLMSQNLHKLDLGRCTTLKNLMVVGNSLKRIENIENATSLEQLFLIFENIEELDLSRLNNLQVLYLGNAPVTRNSVDMLAGTSIKHTTKIKFPSHFKLVKYNEDDYIANYDESSGLIIANNPGETVITSNYMSYDMFVTGAEVYQNLKTYINVYDIKSKKVLINKEYKYIFNENNETNKVLNRHIKVYGEDVSKEIKDNKVYMYKGDKKIFTFDILELTSNDYKIDNNKNTIFYSGTFDINKLNVVNGSLNKINDEIQLICNDNIVKTYKLEKK